MAPSSVAIDTMQRLVDQVQALSSVAETLTLRLLELEERLQRQERAIAEPVALDLGALAERRLAESELRLQGLEQMLAALPLAPGPELVALPDPADAHTRSDDPIEAEAAAVAESSGGVQRDGIDPAATDEPSAGEDEGWQVEADWDDLERLTA